ncbi:MAG: hypothetical protein ACXABJ_07015 [Candidatus Heimdallarchaeaceae archaeon]|jgi:Fe2+ or Zn2+ uptake regulation protein
MEYEDVITYEPEDVKIVFNPQITDIFTDTNYAPVIRALTKEYLTVKELIGKIEESTSIVKSPKTIYRYLKELKKHGVIIQVGQRVTKGKKATEALFGKTAKIIYFYQAHKDFWIDDECKEESELVLKRMAKVFSKRWMIPEPDTKCLRELLVKNDEYIPIEMKKILEVYVQQSEEEGHEFTSQEMYRIINLARSIVPMLETEYLEKELKKCFPSKIKS